MIEVKSEVGRLRSVLIHEPGGEVDRMVPAMMEELLFDDILYGDRARDEHGRFRRVLRSFDVEVVEASALLAEALAEPEAREWVLDVLLVELPDSQREELCSQSAEELAAHLVVGLRAPGSSTGLDVDDLYSIPPLPNWCFQRDPQVVLSAGILFCSMASPARYRESLLSRATFRFHPRLRDLPVLFDPIEADRDHPLFLGDRRPKIEGGDLLVLSEQLLVVGLSERTNRIGIRRLARTLACREGAPRWMLVVEIPRRRAYMHLDTLITQVDRDACLVHAPVILSGGAEEARVYEIDLHAAEPVWTQREHLLAAAARRGVALAPIRCGGSDSVTQQREQWTDGANALAVSPGLITLYDRNVATAEELDRSGFRIVEAEDLLLGRTEIDPSTCGRACVLVRSHEMSRARGGPHCLTHPLLREA